MGALSRWLRSDWAGPLFIVVVGGGAIAMLRRSFLSPFNIEILLLAIATNTLIALSQMVIIGIGQMNLSVGGIGGLAAISFAGMMQVWGLPPMLAASAALAIGILCGILNGALVARTGISAFVITLATFSIFKGASTSA
jgi:ribose transport system permease protein